MHILVHEIDGEEDACAATVLPLAEGYLADCPENFCPTNVLAYTPTDGDAVHFETELVRISQQGEMWVYDSDSGEGDSSELALSWSACEDQTVQSGRAVYYARTNFLTSLPQLISFGKTLDTRHSRPIQMLRFTKLYTIAGMIDLPRRAEYESLGLSSGAHASSSLQKFACRIFDRIDQDMQVSCESDELRLPTFEQFADEMNICGMVMGDREEPGWMEGQDPLSFWHFCYCCWGELIRSCKQTYADIKHLEETVSPAT
jgi:hypothetical protein